MKRKRKTSLRQSQIKTAYKRGMVAGFKRAIAIMKRKI